MENVDALLECGWCPSIVSMVLRGDRYGVLLGPRKQSEDFEHLQLRPSVKWKDGTWKKKEVVTYVEI